MLDDIFNYIENTNLEDLKQELEKYGVKFKKKERETTLLKNYQCNFTTWSEEPNELRLNNDYTFKTKIYISLVQYKYENIDMFDKGGFLNSIYNNSRAA